MTNLTKDQLFQSVNLVFKHLLSRYNYLELYQTLRKLVNDIEAREYLDDAVEQVKYAFNELTADYLEKAVLNNLNLTTTQKETKDILDAFETKFHNLAVYCDLLNSLIDANERYIKPILNH